MNDHAQIERHEERLRQAMLAGAVNELDALLSPSLLFTNQNGARLTKDDDLSAHRSGRLSIDRLEPIEPTIRLLGDTAIVCVTTELAGRYDGQPFGGRFAYTRVWHRQDECWRIAAGHCSAIVA